MAQRNALRLAQVGHEALKGRGLHTGHTLGADLLLVSQNAHGGALRRFYIKNCAQLRIGHGTVVVPVGADQGAVKAHIAGPGSWHGGEFSRDQILLRDPVPLVEYL